MATNILRNALRVALCVFLLRWLFLWSWTAAERRVDALDAAMALMTSDSASVDLTGIVFVTSSLILLTILLIAVGRLRRHGLRRGTVAIGAIAAATGLWLTTSSEAHMLDLMTRSNACLPFCAVADVLSEPSGSPGKWMGQVFGLLMVARGTIQSLVLWCLTLGVVRLIVRDMNRVRWHASRLMASTATDQTFERVNA